MGSCFYPDPDNHYRLQGRPTTECGSLSDDESKDSRLTKRRKRQKVKQSFTRVYSISEARWTLGAGCRTSRDVTSNPEFERRELARPMGQVQAILDNIQQWSTPVNMLYRSVGVSTDIGSSGVDSSDAEDSVTTSEADNHPVRPPLAGDCNSPFRNWTTS
ncbi:hypothetical protein MCOR25_000491 [Pyricularia grisea]|nr:hypothetical protein MCOR25_000491 [Pyricularia grisea]